ncbi:nickel-responsive transcriptional regulator NikR [Alkanindiges illinoisensis]|uniref:nickel-responsive transcriptional regulator NikR n=1 Tax=Alkanindiges illinoisensis TaxID=197183 RepID=UPI000685E159|nr:nickel-responsive transcriptional regulator NikR [Alkanindiges illinoisensis]
MDTPLKDLTAEIHSQACSSVAPVSRITMSLPQELLRALDDMVTQRGFDSRSQAIADMIHQQVMAHKQKLGNEVMVGTITLLYDRSMPNLQRQIADLQYQNLSEVISSLHVSLADNQMMEVVLIQGRACQLEKIANQLITLRGVITGNLQLLTAIMPPISSPATAPA